MPPYSPHPLLGSMAAVFLSATMLAAATLPSSISVFPAPGSSEVNPDTQLVISFSTPPTVGKTGLIRIIDTTTNTVVDTLDLSIPAGPAPRGPVPSLASLPKDQAALRARQAYARESAPLGRVTNANAVAGTVPGRPNSTPLKDYQLTIIGGVQQGFHFHPIIVRGSQATLYPHNNLLQYGKRYRVEIDAGVLSVDDGSFQGIKRDHGWTFSTKACPPSPSSTKLVVSKDGSGDFNTVQGALDFVPDNPTRRITIFVKNGHYEEIVFFHGKSNLTILGEDRQKVQIGYGNNSRFNSPLLTDAEGKLLGGPSRRCAFACYNSQDIIFANFSVNNYYMGQAEALLISGSRNIVSHVSINGSGDALNLRGPVYFSDCSIIGHGDTILNVGPAFFRRCELSSWGPYLWVRNPATNHGDIFVDCVFNTPPGDNPLFGRMTRSVIARLPNNKGINYPYAEAVLINCKLHDIPPEGWGPIDDDTSNVHFWEYNSTNLADGKPVDVSRRHPVSKQLTMEQDAQIIANYSSPSFVLGGWEPCYAPLFLTQPVSTVVSRGEAIVLETRVTALPESTGQWFKDGKPIPGAISQRLVLKAEQPEDAGRYTFVARNASGSTTSDEAIVSIR